MLADKVALLQNGTITDVGTHRELLATVPAYRNLLAADAEGDEASDDLGGTAVAGPTMTRR
jgi:ATP-binding cassette subfamily B protein